MFSITDEELQVFNEIVGKLSNFEGILSEFCTDPMLLDLFVMKVHDYMCIKSYDSDNI